MLELAALGLLQREPLHGYRLMKHLELLMSCCITVNYGAVYPLLRRMEQRGYVAALAGPEAKANSGRNLYQITEQGRARWLEKMQQYPKESWVNGKSRFMIKVFFFQDLAPSLRISLLEHRLIQCQLRRQSLEAEKTTRESLDAYQLAGFQHGMALLDLEVDWLLQFLSAEKSKAAQFASCSTVVQPSSAPVFPGVSPDVTSPNVASPDGLLPSLEPRIAL